MPGLFYLHDSVEVQAAGECICAVIGIFVCLVFFAGYLLQQYLHSTNPTSKTEKVREDFLRTAIAEGKVTLLGVMASEARNDLLQEQQLRRTGGGSSGGSRETYAAAPRRRRSSYGTTTAAAGGTAGDSAARAGAGAVQTEHTSLLSSSIDGVSNTAAGAGAGSGVACGVGPDLLPGYSDAYIHRLRGLLRPFFHCYDETKDNMLNKAEMRMVFSDLGEDVSPQVSLYRQQCPPSR